MQEQFDRKSYERDMRRALLLRQLPRYVVALALAGGLFVLAMVAISPQYPPMDPSVHGSSTAPVASQFRPQVPMNHIPDPQLALGGRALLEQAINGQLDNPTRDSLRQYPEFDQCDQCFKKCEEDPQSESSFGIQECRRDCLRNCSEHARQVMN